MLGVPAASIHTHDDFFRLGGHSISCIQLLMHIWERLRLVVTVEDMPALNELDLTASVTPPAKLALDPDLEARLLSFEEQVSSSMTQK